jgi:hypothetical protein
VLYIVFRLFINAILTVSHNNDTVDQLSTTILFDGGAKSNHQVIVYHKFLYESGIF